MTYIERGYCPVRSDIWSLYADLKEYKQNPTIQRKAELHQRFDAVPAFADPLLPLDTSHPNGSFRCPTVIREPAE